MEMIVPHNEALSQITPNISLETLKAEGVTVMDEIERVEEGKFGQIVDLEGNKIELWELNYKAFL